MNQIIKTILTLGIPRLVEAIADAVRKRREEKQAVECDMSEYQRFVAEQNDARRIASAKRQGRLYDGK